MPRYSDELIEEVRSRNDIVDVISQYVRLSKKGSTYFGLCPFHNEKTGSFSVSPNKQMCSICVWSDFVSGELARV